MHAPKHVERFSDLLLMVTKAIAEIIHDVAFWRRVPSAPGVQDVNDGIHLVECIFKVPLRLWGRSWSLSGIITRRRKISRVHGLAVRFVELDDSRI